MNDDTERMDFGRVLRTLRNDGVRNVSHCAQQIGRGHVGGIRPFRMLQAAAGNVSLDKLSDGSEQAVAMNRKQPHHLFATCRCGMVKLEAIGQPILAAACYCASCQEAGRRFEQSASAPAILNPDGGTDYVLYRKDRVQCVAGQEYLEEHRLKPDSPTRRVVATCCHSGMFVDFTRGHWLTIYRNRFPTGAPPIEMRVMTQHRREGVALADDVPNHEGHAGTFMMRLLVAWIAMGFRRPECMLGKATRKTVGRSS